MRGKSKTTLIAVVTLGFTCIEAKASDLHEYKIPNLPATKERCDEQAASVARKLAAEPDISIVGVACKAAPEGFDLVISYAAPRAVDITSSEPTYPYRQRTGYSSLRDCHHELASERTVFLTHTGLEPLVSYCYRVYPSGVEPYRIKIDAIGTPRLTPRIEELSVPGYLIGEAWALTDQIEETFARNDSYISKARLNPDIAGKTLQLRYYAKDELPFHLSKVADFDSEQACLNESAALALAPFAVDFCTTWNRKAQLQLLQLEGAAMARSDLLPTDYPSKEACEDTAQESPTYSGPNSNAWWFTPYARCTTAAFKCKYCRKAYFNGVSI